MKASNVVVNRFLEAYL